MAARSQPSTVRIIGGKYRGRKLRFAGNATLRPTLGRTRETLFNWLRGELGEARVLDLFAGSGILGFEALSQGAAHATLVEKNRRTLDMLADTREQLKLSKQECAIVAMDALKFIQQSTLGFDIAFVDPPFEQPDLLERACQRLIEGKLVHRYLYLEAPSTELIERVRTNLDLTLHKQTRAGDAWAALLAV